MSKRKMKILCDVQWPRGRNAGGRGVCERRCGNWDAHRPVGAARAWEVFKAAESTRFPRIMDGSEGLA